MPQARRQLGGSHLAVDEGLAAPRGANELEPDAPATPDGASAGNRRLDDTSPSTRIPAEPPIGPSSLPREARDGLMRAWLEILRERHPGVAWVPVDSGEAMSSAGEAAAGRNAALRHGKVGRPLEEAE